MADDDGCVVLVVGFIVLMWMVSTCSSLRKIARQGELLPLDPNYAPVEATR